MPGKNILQTTGCRYKQPPGSAASRFLHVACPADRLEHELARLAGTGVSVDVCIAEPVDALRLAAIMKSYPSLFIIIFDTDATNNAIARQSLMDNGARMVTSHLAHVEKALQVILAQEGGDLKCPVCGLGELNSVSLHHHMPLYHINEPNTTGNCPICKVSVARNHQNMQQHIHEDHHPTGHSESAFGKSVLYSFSLVVVRRPSDGKYLLTQEYAGVGYWLPGGKVDAGETFQEAAVREVREETGIDCTLKGLLALENSVMQGHHRQRAIFYAECDDSKQPPKTLPDYESAGAVYISCEELVEQFQSCRLNLRGGEPLTYFQLAEKQRTTNSIVPVSVLIERS